MNGTNDYAKLIHDLRAYAAQHERPPYGRAIVGEEDLERRAAAAIEDLLAQNERLSANTRVEIPLWYLEGPWRNDSCRGYAILAMQRAGLNYETIRKVMAEMTWCFDDTSDKDAARHYCGW